MTKEQADEMLAVLRDIREQVTRMANVTVRDGTFINYPRAVIVPDAPQSGAELQTRLDALRGG